MTKAIDKSIARALASCIPATELDEYVRIGFDVGFRAQREFAAQHCRDFDVATTIENVEYMTIAIDDAATEAGLF